jgi:hypothetical protein
MSDVNFFLFTSRKWIRTLLVFYSLLITVVSAAQISYNGNFEYVGGDSKNLKWFYQPSASYKVSVDSSV